MPECWSELPLLQSSSTYHLAASKRRRSSETMIFPPSVLTPSPIMHPVENLGCALASAVAVVAGIALVAAPLMLPFFVAAVAANRETANPFLPPILYLRCVHYAGSYGAHRACFVCRGSRAICCNSREKVGEQELSTTAPPGKTDD